MRFFSVLSRQAKTSLVVFITLISQQGFACKCVSPENVQEAIPKYDLVFHGNVTGSQVVRVEGFNKRIWYEKIVTFVPDTVFTGNVPDTINIKYQSAMNMCSSRKLKFIIGRFYSIGVDKPSVQKIHTMENGQNYFETNGSIQFGKVYPELDDCGFVLPDSGSIHGK